MVADENTALQREALHDRKAGPKGDIALSGEASVLPKISLSRSFYITLAVLALLSLATRFYRISAGNTVVWDEAHFGKFGSYYLNRTFYTDVHPPLGKMLVGLSGYLSGYNGSFKFPSGMQYPEHVDYVSMRMWLALFGVLCVPIAYATAVFVGISPSTSLFVSLCLLLDNGVIGISRLILLDGMLLFFTVLATFSLALFLNYRDRPFSREWWLSMAFSGLSIGLVSRFPSSGAKFSVKWVGFFVTALVGCHAIKDLWDLYGDYRVPKARIGRHLAARALCLIALPVAIYIASFWIHFKILNRSGPGDGQMGSFFQARLKGNDISRSPLNVAFGSRVTVRSSAVGGALLHSHPLVYPEGSEQQQVTCYYHKDENNHWIVSQPHSSEVGEADDTPIQLLKHGDVVRLVHAKTGANLHSHGFPSSMTKADYEVSAYGNLTNYPDVSDHWVVELVSDRMENHEGVIRNVLSTFRLRHQVLGCYLASSKTLLPDWASSQIEVSCEKAPSKHSLWNVETNLHPKLPPGKASLYGSSFWSDLVEVHENMWRTNNALIQDAETEPGPLTSSPSGWPLLLTGIRMTSFDDSVTKFYMLGNPLVWWLGAASVAGLSLLLCWLALRAQREGSPVGSGAVVSQSQVVLLGWTLQYAPFYLMGRVLYLHHYYPALFFALLCSGVLIDHMARAFSKQTKYSLLALATAMIAWCFCQFSPTCYGLDGPAASGFAHLHWLSSWNIHKN